jgi:hypothetical protein
MMSRNFARTAEDYVKGFMETYKVLIQYLRTENGDKYGVVVAFRLNPTGPTKLGHSVCNLEAGDTFNKYIGLYIAIQRALKGGHTSLRNAGALATVYGLMQVRCAKYFRATPVNV